MVEGYELLARTPATLSSLIGGAPPEALPFREAADTWSIPEVLCHLADGEVVDWMPRIRRILSDEPDIPFEPFDREAGFARYHGWPVGALLQEFSNLRRQNLEELARLDLQGDRLTRTGVHPELGPVTLQQLIATWVTHDVAHIAQISRVLVRYFGQGAGPWKAYFSLLR